METRLFLGDLLKVRSDLQQQVMERERYLSNLIDSAPFGIVSTDTDGSIVTFNNKAETMYGYRQTEVVGKPLSILSDEGEVAAVPPLEGHPLKVSHRRKNGSRVPVLVYACNVLDGKGKRIARLQVLEDQTAREQMEAQLLQAERLSVLGQLAPRVAHEFKTPLQAILSNAELIAYDMEQGEVEQVGQSAGEIVQAVQQMQGSVQQMLNLGKPTESKEEELDLGLELNRILGLLTPLKVLEHCRVTTEIESLLPSVKGDAAQIEQVLRNLIVNAAHALEDSEQRELRLSVRADDTGRSVVCTVSDSGCGIPEDQLKQVFQPFFTTKPEGMGTGLGLPIVKTILDRHNASVRVQSEIGKGTSFTLSFPTVVSDQISRSER